MYSYLPRAPRRAAVPLGHAAAACYSMKSFLPGDESPRGVMPAVIRRSSIVTSTGSDEDLALPGDRGPFRFRQCRHGVMAFLRSDSTIGRSLDLYGEFAESENQLLMPLLRPGDACIDVGANVGTVALALAWRVGAAGHVYAFEPQHVILQ